MIPDYGPQRRPIVFEIRIQKARGATRYSQFSRAHFERYTDDFGLIEIDRACLVLSWAAIELHIRASA